MKKFILLLTSIYISIASATSAMEAMIASGVAAGLMPILEPLVKETLLASIGHVKGVITGHRCLIGCTKVNSLYCKTETGLSTCKATCQHITTVGGYELRIRFDYDEAKKKNKWDLANCVRHGVEGGMKTPVGKENAKSIALYSKEDLEGLLKLISVQMVAQQVVNTKGQELDQQHLREQGKSREEVVADASKLIENIDKSIRKMLRIMFIIINRTSV